MDSGPVIVIGAGLAGLTAAWKLRRAGIEVVVLEAEDRVGGRAHTTTDGWQSGQYADYGGELIFPGYHALTSVCAEVGVELSEPVTLAELEPSDITLAEGFLRVGSFVVDGRRLTRSDQLGLAAELRTAATAHPPAAQEIVEQWIRRAGLGSDAAGVVRALARFFCQLDPWDCDVHFLTGIGEMRCRRVLGGTQRLAIALANGSDVRLGRTVSRISRVGGVRVETEQGEVFSGSRVICAVGPHAMPRIGFDPPLPDEKIMTALSLLPAMGGKLLAQYAEGDAVREVFRTVVYTDGPINSAWVGSPQVTEGPAVVAGFLTGVSRHTLHDAEKSLRLLDELVSQAIGAPVTRLVGEVKSWWSDPHAMGITTTPPEAARPEIASIFQAVERRTHLAGDYTDAGFAGTLEGAVRSGIRAADEVLRVPSRFHTADFNERLARA